MTTVFGYVARSGSGLREREESRDSSAHVAPANAEGAKVAVMRHGCQRGERFEGYECAVGNVRVGPGSSGQGRSVTETQRILFGSGMQQAHTERCAQAVEVVRNHEDGSDSRVVPAVRVRGWNLWWESGHCSYVEGRTFMQMNSMAGGCRDASRLTKGVPEGEGKIKREGALLLPN